MARFARFLVWLTLCAALPGMQAWAVDFDQAAAAFKNKDYQSALAAWRTLAKKGNAAAQYDLALMYAHGYGVAQNDALAVSWYKEAAKQGYAKAEHNLAVHLQHGRGVEQDYKAAARWYGKAAEQGLAPAQNNLAMLYAQGLGVDKNLAKAAYWAAAAAQQGNKAAIRNLNQMLKGKPQMEVAGSNVNVRAEPGTNAEILMQSDEGARVVVLNSRDDWKQVLFDDDHQIGWIAGFLLRPASESAAKQ
ncbi:MAG: SH3 domain-containing protein [Salinisphaera sp.]|nr:SH3 domain-containing protein [Salinisphaera sp.]